MYDAASPRSRPLLAITLIGVLIASLLTLAATPADAAPEGPVQLISVTAEGGASGDDHSQGVPSISDDGRYVAFTSRATDLVAGLTDANGANFGDVYVRDTLTGTTRLVSHAAGMPTTTASGGSSGSPHISGDGSYIVYETFANNIVSGVTDGNGERDLYVYSVASGTNALVSRSAGSPTTTCDNGVSVGASISTNGNWIAFQSNCDDLVTNQDPGPGDFSNIFLHDRVNGTTEVVSRPNAVNPNIPGGITTGNGSSISPRISGSGEVVVYTTLASNIGPDDTNGTADVGYFRRANAGGGNLPAISTVISYNEAGNATANGASSDPSVSDDGQYVAFVTEATNIAPGSDGNNGVDVILEHLPFGMNSTTSRVSRTPMGDAGNGLSFKPRISGDGSYVAFLTTATNIITSPPTKSSTVWDVVRYNRADDSIVLVSRNTMGNGGGDNDSGSPSFAPGLDISRDGNDIIYTSEATNLSALDSMDNEDVYATEMSTGTVRLLSRNAAGTAQHDGEALQPSISGSGNYATFASSGTDLTDDIDANGADRDVFAIAQAEMAVEDGAIGIDDVTLPEGDEGTTPFNFTVSIASPAPGPGPVTVDYATMDASATAGSPDMGGDYQATSGTASIPPGSSSTTVTVLVYGDTDPEPDETFKVVLSNPSMGYIISGTMGVGTGIILDDDGVDPGPGPPPGGLDLRDGVNDTLRVVGEGPTPNADVALRLSQATFGTGPSEPGPGPGPGPDPGPGMMFAQTGRTTEALLATDGGFADSLASGALQTIDNPMTSPAPATINGRPLLLTATDQLYPSVREELTRLGVSSIRILGGVNAIAEPVAQELRNAGYTVSRYEGPTRLETATAIAGGAFPGATTAILARAFPAMGGEDTQAFADSLAAGAWAAERQWPLLFTQTEVLSTSTMQYLASSQIRTVYVVGGTAAINESVLETLRGMGITVIRVAGDTRFDTALAIAEQRGYMSEADASLVMLLEGQAGSAWAAGFAGAAYAAIHRAPVVLGVADQVPPQTQAFLDPPVGPMPGPGPGPSEGSPGPAEFAVDVDNVTGYVLVCGIAPMRCDEGRSLLGLPDLAQVVKPMGEHVRGGPLPYELGGPFNASGAEAQLSCRDDGPLTVRDGPFGASQGLSEVVSIPVPGDTPTGPCSVTIRIRYPNGSMQTAVADVTVTSGG